jgi:O-acetyl-ADP-ribose deacetylase (regulator of RNase III)
LAAERGRGSRRSLAIFRSRAAAGAQAGRRRADSSRISRRLACDIFDLLDFARLFAAFGASRMSVRITLKEGDIASEAADAIVNAANSALVLGSGVAGAIRAKGGPEIQAECDRHGPIAVGDAAVTTAGKLAARFVIHAATMPPGGAASEASVRSAMRSSLASARELGVKTLAVPALGAGVAGFSLQRCAEVLLEEARAHAGTETSLEEIRFVLFGEPAYRMFEMVNDAGRVTDSLAKLRARPRASR